MKVSINIKVRNAEWYHSNGEMGAYLEEWQMINEGKIAKHVPAVDFEYRQDVKSYKNCDHKTYQIAIYVSDEFDTQTEHKFILENVTVVEFELENSTSSVIVADELIYQYLAANRSGGRLYWYFYLKEDAPFVPLATNIWITEQQFNAIKSKYPNFTILANENLKQRSFVGIL